MMTNLAVKFEEQENFEDNIVLMDLYKESAIVKDFSGYREAATKIINIIYDEAEKIWKNKRAIRNALMEIDKYNVCNFIKIMSIMSDTNEVFSEIKNDVTCIEIYNIINSLLQCSVEFELNNTYQHKQLNIEMRILIAMIKENKRKISLKKLKVISDKLISLYKMIEKQG